MKDRIYVCHTFYHAYISFLKELKIIDDAKKSNTDPGEATLMLSKMSNDFGDMGNRILSTKVFNEVVDFDEKREDFFPELQKYRKPGNIVINLINRMLLYKKFAKAEEAVIPVNFKEYKDIYVFCDRDPIGIYLSGHKIRYHAVEDGLNTLKYVDLARHEDRKLFGLKAFLSKKLNLLFICNGYAKYCIDMEVNDKSVLKYVPDFYIEAPRKELTDRLTDDDKNLLLRAFIRDIDTLNEQINAAKDKDKILILTDPLCSLDVREKIFKDIITMYEKEGEIFIKPHPRDVLDYRKLFSEYPQFDATIPMELLNFFPDLHFKKAVGVLTEMKSIDFADEAIRLGADFMDKYEAPEIHRQNEYI